MDVTLKILSGVHVGAEIDLEDGTHSIGSGDECHVIINETTISAHAANIEINDKITLTLVDASDVMLAGKHLTEVDDAIVLSLYDIVELQGVSFVIGEVGVEWPSLDVSINQRTNSPEEVAATLPKTNRRWISSSMIVPILCVGLFGVLLVGSTVLFQSSDSDVASGLSEMFPASLLGFLNQDNHLPTIEEFFENGVLSNPEFSSISVEQINSDNYRAFGYVRERSDKNRLVMTLRESGYKVRTRIYATDEMLETAEQIIMRFNLKGVSVSAGETLGGLTFRGNVDEEFLWSKVLVLIQNDIPGLLHLDNKVVLNQKQILANKEKQIRPKLNIKGVGLGDIPYITLDGGQRYVAGAHIIDGFYLDAIANNSIMLKKGDVLLNYPIGRGY